MREIGSRVGEIAAVHVPKISSRCRLCYCSYVVAHNLIGLLQLRRTTQSLTLNSLNFDELVPHSLNRDIFSPVSHDGAFNHQDNLGVVSARVRPVRDSHLYVPFHFDRIVGTLYEQSAAAAVDSRSKNSLLPDAQFGGKLNRVSPCRPTFRANRFRHKLRVFRIEGVSIRFDWSAVLAAEGC